MADCPHPHASHRGVRGRAGSGATARGNAVVAETTPTTSATVTGLFVHPVKSGRGIACSRVRVAATGFEWDRQWMVVNRTGMFLSQRTHPRLARIVPEITADALVLRAEGAGQTNG